MDTKTNMLVCIAVALGLLISPGYAQSCFDETDKTGCEQISGCVWEDVFSCDDDGSGNGQDCYNGENKTACDKLSSCVWGSPNSYCNEDTVDCFNYINDKDQCNNAKNSQGQKGCQYNENTESSCEPYNACNVLYSSDDCTANNLCQWVTDDDSGTGGSSSTCIYKDLNNNAGSQDCFGDESNDGTYTEFTEQTCSQGNRSGTDVTTSCWWVTRLNPTCNPYDPCSVAQDSNACGQISGCNWDDTDNICTSEDGDDPCINDPSSPDCAQDDGNDTFEENSCFSQLDQDSCENLDGTECEWDTQVNSECEPKNKCRYGTKDNCTNTPGCEYQGGNSGSGSSGGGPGGPGGDDDGFCALEDSSGQDDSCYGKNLNDCASDTACEVVTRYTSFCIQFNVCKEYTDEDACDSLEAQAKNCTWSGAECIADEDTIDDIVDGDQCFNANTKQKCDVVPNDDGGDDPECSWTTDISASCQPYDKCSEIKREGQCDNTDGCEWDGDDLGDESNCVSDGSGTTDSTQIDIQCFDYTDPDECNNAGIDVTNPDAPRVCVYQLTNSSYCTQYSPCLGGNRNTQEGCDATDGCWWDGFGEGPYDGSCVEGSPPTSTTSGTTTNTPPATTPAPTQFSCGPQEFKCETEDKCISIDWTCDSQDDCDDGSDEKYELCPTESSTTTTKTPGTCASYQIKCANRQCVEDFFKNKRCDGKPDCDDLSDETNCPTSAPTPRPTTAQPTTSSPTPAPSPLPTRSPSKTPRCLDKCNNDLNLLDEALLNPNRQTPGECRACVDGYSSLEEWCCSSASDYPPTLDCTCDNCCKDDGDIPNQEYVYAYFFIPSNGPSEGTYESAIKQRIMAQQSISSDDVNVIVTSTNQQRIYRAQIDVAFKSQYDDVLRSVNEGTLILLQGNPAGMPRTTFSATMMNAPTTANPTQARTSPNNPPTTSSPTRAPIRAGETQSPTKAVVAPTTAAPSTKAPTTSKPTQSPVTAGGSSSSSSGGNAIVIVIVIIIVFVLIAVGVVVFVMLKFRNSSGSAKISRTTYGNPVYASALPPWADPNVEFLSREEAEAKLRADGMKNCSYVVRQTTGTPNGYVITSVNRGEFTNIQLKFANGALNYGGRAVGGNLDEALRTLKNSVQVQPKNGSPYYLGESNLDFEADA